METVCLFERLNVGSIDQLTRQFTCGLAPFDFDKWLCTADRLLQLIDEPGNAEARRLVNGTAVLEVPPQDAATNAALAQVAHAYATRVLQSAYDRFSPGGGNTCLRSAWDDPVGFGPLASRTAIEETLALVERAIHVADDAAERAAELGAATTDAYGSDPEPSSRANRELEAQASRAAAAHLYVGGDHGLPGNPDVAARGGFFLQPRPSTATRAAIELLRTLAPNPFFVAKSDLEVPLLDLVLGQGQVPIAESLRNRAEGFIGSEISTANEFYREVGLSEEALTSARVWLREEITAFDRARGSSSSVRSARTLPPEPLPDGSSTSDPAGPAEAFTLYAATRVSPRQHPPAYWAALLRYDPSPVLLSTSYPTLGSPPPWLDQPSSEGTRHIPGSTYGTEGSDAGWATVTNFDTAGRNHSWARWQAHRFAQLVMSQVDVNVPAGEPSSLRDAVRQSLRSLETLTTGVGTARACWWERNTGFDDIYFQIALESPIDPSRIILVAGREGMECAVEGRVDGVP